MSSKSYMYNYERATLSLNYYHVFFRIIVEVLK